MPNVERFCTYRQCVDYVRRYCPFLSSTERNACSAERSRVDRPAMSLHRASVDPRRYR